jgi:mersacidin/lichenicidin family type 2 lantibiotic
MSHAKTVRAWRDYDFWLGLSDAERGSIPANPAGVTELMDAEMDFVAGGSDTLPDQTCTSSCISTYTASHTRCCF